MTYVEKIGEQASMTIMPHIAFKLVPRGSYCQVEYT